MTVSGRKTAGLLVAISGAMVPSAVLMAQSNNPDSGPTGIQTSFGLSLRTEAQDNRDLDPESAGNSFETSAGLSFGLLTETRTSQFSFEAAGQLRSIDTPTGELEDGFVEPRVALSYGHESAAAKLSVDVSLLETKLSRSSVFVLDDIEVVTNGTSTRRNARLDAEIDWGLDRPLGFGLRGSVSDTTYREGTASGLGFSTLNDNRRTSLGASVRMDLSQTAELRMDLTASELAEDGTQGTQETVTLENRLTLEGPRGDVRFNLNFTRTDDGERTEASWGRSVDLPLGALSWEIGVIRKKNGDTSPVGQLDYSHTLPSAELTFEVSRDVSSSNEQDTERTITSVNFGYLQDLTQRSSVTFNADWTDIEETNTGLEADIASFEATYSHELTRDWNVDVGYRYLYRDDTDIEAAQSNTLFVDFRRVFTGSF